MQPYEKLLPKIKGELKSLHAEIKSLPDASLLNLPAILIAAALKPESFKKVDEIRRRLGKLKSQVKSTLDTYSRGKREEGSAAYLSRIVELGTEIKFLEERLAKKDLRQLLHDNEKEKDNRAKSGGEAGGKEESEWGSIDLKS
jgi:ATP/maltotriose-dependent transcriptional regulator MalT